MMVEEKEEVTSIAIISFSFATIFRFTILSHFTILSRNLSSFSLLSVHLLASCCELELIRIKVITKSTIHHPSINPIRSILPIRPSRIHRGEEE